METGGQQKYNNGAIFFYSGAREKHSRCAAPTRIIKHRRGRSAAHTKWTKMTLANILITNVRVTINNGD